MTVAVAFLNWSIRRREIGQLKTRDRTTLAGIVLKSSSNTQVQSLPKFPATSRIEKSVSSQGYFGSVCSLLVARFGSWFLFHFASASFCSLANYGGSSLRETKAQESEVRFRRGSVFIYGGVSGHNSRLKQWLLWELCTGFLRGLYGLRIEVVRSVRLFSVD